MPRAPTSPTASSEHGVQPGLHGPGRGHQPAELVVGQVADVPPVRESTSAPAASLTAAIAATGDTCTVEHMFEH